MGYFGIDDDDDLLLSEDEEANEELEQVAEDICNTDAAIGDVVYYDPVSYCFSSFSTEGGAYAYSPDMKNDTWRTIMIGIVVNQNEDDHTVDVLMSGFLMAEPLTLPFRYIDPVKRKCIQPYVADLFKRFVSAFFRQCPGYNDLLALDIQLPTVSDLLKVRRNMPGIFKTLEECSEPVAFQNFISRLLDGYVYATHKGKLYMMELGSAAEGEKDEIKKDDGTIINPTPFARGDFLCMFRRVNLYGTLNKETSETEENEEEYFNDNL